MSLEIKNIKNIKVSIIVPCYNCYATLNRTVNSVLSQTYTNWELILVNNNSSDQTETLLKHYKERYPSKVLLECETKKGAPSTRNKGLSLASGQWIQFLDADDEILPNKIEEQIKIVINNPELPLIAGAYLNIVEKKNIKKSLLRPLHSDFWIGLSISQLGITSANLFKRDCLVDVGGWDVSLAASQEYDLMFRLLKKYPQAGLDNLVNTYIHVNDSISISRPKGKEHLKNILDARIGLRLRIKEFLKMKGMLSQEREQEIDYFVYRQLYIHYRFLPLEMKAQLQKLNLRLNFSQQIEGNYFMFKMDLKRMMIKIGLLKS